MAISTFNELKSAIADYLARNDLTSQIVDFIALAEGRLNRKLRTHDMEASATVTMTSGSGPLPSDYLEWISATWVGVRTHDLRYVEPDSEEWRFRYRPNGDPAMFSIIASTLKLRPVITGDVTLAYYQKIPALATNSTNWLLTRAPDLYLNYSLAEAYILTKDEERALAYLALAERGLDGATKDGDSNKIERRPSRNAEVQNITTARNPQTSGL